MCDGLRTRGTTHLSQQSKIRKGKSGNQFGTPGADSDDRFRPYKENQRQKKRGQAAERNIAINDEVSKLVAAGIMREVHYHDWLSNPMMVKKSDNSWRMCVDSKDLNKACPKDDYPLPEIDWKVESLPIVSVKGQVLADFIIERPEEEGQDDSSKKEEPLPAQWTYVTDVHLALTDAEQE
ncbi:hypothetical protein Tco_0910977 [Tanacetum coccineum]|uniref:Reverse transcriptase domain-containing protein n=1 Tax=Tanacetum coccineum TaxID=301880 RepID=A0ABQ5CVX8_9ASTR